VGTKSEIIEKQVEEQLLSQEITNFWTEFVDKSKCDLELNLSGINSVLITYLFGS
jgi:hypothetical protein